MLHKIKVQAKDVSLAIEKGLKELRLRRDQVEVKVLENPRKGFLGIGAKKAVVEVWKKRWMSDDLDAQIYMDVPKKKRTGGKKSGGRRKHENGVREIKHTGRRSYGASRQEKAPRENEPQLLPSLEIQNALVPDYIKAPLQEAKDYVHQILTHMGVKVENLNAWWDEKQQRILLTFDCDAPAIVIGKDGKTLESLQYLATLSISRHFDKAISVIADTQNYWRKAEDKINAELNMGIEKIKKGYSVYRFRPMSAQLRRYIHRAAENNEFAITVSEGEGQWRKVTLRPRPADQPVKKANAPVEQPAQTTAVATETNPVTETAKTAAVAAASVENQPAATLPATEPVATQPAAETTVEAAAAPVIAQTETAAQEQITSAQPAEVTTQTTK